MDGGAMIRPLGRVPVRVETADVVVIGSGLAGLVAALDLAPRRVTLLTKTADLPGGSSLWAQGGVAGALDPADSADAHAADTVAAGAGLTDPAMAALLARDGAAALRRWLDCGLPADRRPDGSLSLGREAAHSTFRILHAGGDATGRTLTGWFADRVRQAPHVDVRTGAFAWRIQVADGRVAGVLAHHADTGWVFHRTARIVLATGGVGQIYRHTTNPEEATADGLALAARAGARLADLEFVQFHPTALAADFPGRTPLLTEALRGAGAHLLDGTGRRFMLEEHPEAELAPRDVVARAIGRRIAAGQSVFLDLRSLWAAGGAQTFPTVAAICTQAGLDPAVQPIPVAPAAHYHMGGVLTDADGRTSLPGLWACGEVACTGVHGANRLASNSLLEALVFAQRAAAAIAGEPGHPPPFPPAPAAPSIPVGTPDMAGIAEIARAVMATRVGLVRDGDGLAGAVEDLEALQRRADRLPLVAEAGADAVRAAGELRNRLLASRLIARAALSRPESRGAHFRSDTPQPRGDWQFRQVVTVEEPAEPALADLETVLPA